MKSYLVLILLSLQLLNAQSLRTTAIIDSCSSITYWKTFQSLGVIVKQTTADGAIKFDIDFSKGSGYGGIVRNFNLPLPENFEISFLMKATVPVNNFEIKISDDSTGENIWWLNQKNYTYPTDWKKIVIKKRHLTYAWGTKYAPYPSKLSRIEIVVTAGTGGKGSVWIDELALTELPPKLTQIPKLKFTASSSTVNKNIALPWQSKKNTNEWFEANVQYEKEFGGLALEWDKSLQSVSYDILVSLDGKKYDLLKSIHNGKARKVIHYLPESEARYIKLALKENSAHLPFNLKNFRIIPIDSLSHPNQYFELLASENEMGLYPRYFSKQQLYWTVVGVPTDTKEALFSEDGAFEVDRQKFSIEPFVVLNSNKKVLHWNNGKNIQSLEENYLPIPSVERVYSDITLRTTVLTVGKPESSAIVARYVIKNISSQTQQGSFYLALRPFQVNPSSQWLNYDGGFAKTSSMKFDNNFAMIDDKVVYVSGSVTATGTATIEQGDISDFISNQSIPSTHSSVQEQGFVSGAFQYSFNLKPGDSLVVISAVPFTNKGNRWKTTLPSETEFKNLFTETKELWKKKLTTVEFNVPADVQRLVNIIRTNLAYILINKDKNGFQPGSRSYERSWMRDGSMTSDALLKLGLTEEPKNFIDWISSFQYENGAVPCVVDTRGPDPVPEHDSHGQLIFAIVEYFRFTKDTVFLREKWKNIVAAINYIQSLRAQRMTDEYKNGNNEKRAFYGLVTESISHEGYSDKPMHSYWDNFFVLKGFKDAAYAAKILGKNKDASMYDSLAKNFREILYNSINLVTKNKNINYMPGCVEKGDFDATSTSIALFPNGEMKFVPQPLYNNTFDKYFDWCVQRTENKIIWNEYTPYEIRNVGTYIYLGQKQRAHYLLEYFLNDQRPQSWNHWAEVVAKGYRTMRFIGDMPHTWVGSDYINAVRAMFAYEIDDDNSIVIGAGLKEEWIKQGLSIKNLPTHYGNISYTISSDNNAVKIVVTGNIDTKNCSIAIPATLLSTPVKSITVNSQNRKIEDGYVKIQSLPATITLQY